MLKFKRWAAALCVAACVGPAAAQDIKFACKAVDGWTFEPMPPGRNATRLPGGCDANGLLQGDAYATVSGSNHKVVRSTFVDGRPRGPSVLIGALACNMVFKTDGNIEGDIECETLAPDFQALRRKLKFSSPSGFAVTDDRGPLGLTKFIAAPNILVEAQEGRFNLILGQSSVAVRGKTTGLMTQTRLPLYALLTQGVELSGSRTTVLHAYDAFNKVLPATTRSVQGYVLLDAARLEPAVNRDFRLATATGRGKAAFPAEFEIRVEYVDGTWFSGVMEDRVGNSFFHYQDSRGALFNSLIEDCSQGGRRPGSLRVSRSGGDLLDPGSELKFNASGCASFKAPGFDEVKGIFTPSGVKPF